VRTANNIEMMKITSCLVATAFAAISMGTDAFVVKSAGRAKPGTSLRAIVGQETYSLARSVECAQTMGECSIDELVKLERELTMMNDDCLIELKEQDDICSIDKVESRNILKKTLALQQELHQLEQKLKGMPFVFNMKADKPEVTKEANNDWYTHYVESYHW